MSANILLPVRLDGDLTVQNAAEHKTLLLAALEADDGMELDLSEITEMDTAGLQLLLLFRLEATHLGKTFRLLGASAPVLEVLLLAGLDLQLDQIDFPGLHEPSHSQPEAR